MNRRDPASQPRTPAIKSSIAVLSPRLDFCEGPSSFLAVGFFLETRGTSGTPARFNLLHTLPGFFSGVVAKAFPYGSSCGSNDRFLAEHRNLLRYNMADIETATPEVRPLPHVR
jgi:hypothetical protein